VLGLAAQPGPLPAVPGFPAEAAVNGTTESELVRVAAALLAIFAHMIRHWDDHE
jgi:hypothetical protein